MARQVKTLTLRHLSVAHEVGISKVDRSDIYGTTETEIVDATNAPVSELQMMKDGRTIVAKKSRYIRNENGTISQKDVKYVDAHGTLLQETASMFDAPVDLAVISPQKAMNLVAKSTYVVDLEPELSADLIGALKDGTIYEFQYAWRATTKPSVGIMLANADGVVFFIVGSYAVPRALSIGQAEEADDECTEIEDDEQDEFDFDAL